MFRPLGLGQLLQITLLQSSNSHSLVEVSHNPSFLIWERRIDPTVRVALQNKEKYIDGRPFKLSSVKQT